MPIPIFVITNLYILKQIGLKGCILINIPKHKRATYQKSEQMQPQRWKGCWGMPQSWATLSSLKLPR